MLIIKNIVMTDDLLPAPANQQIRLWEGKNVFFETREVPDIDGSTHLVPTVSFDMPDDVQCSIDTGIVYVMNSSGKTVDTFRLRNSHFL